MDMLVVGRERTMDMMNGESAMSSVREKKQEGEKKSEKRNFELSSHSLGDGLKECGSTKSAGREGRATTLAEQPSEGGAKESEKRPAHSH
jgi:hypothetical protein